MRWKQVLLGIVVGLFLTPQLVKGFPENTFLATSQLSEHPLVCVVVNSTIYNEISPALKQYASDVEKAGFTVKTLETNQLFNATPKGIRKYLQQLLSQKLVGCLLVGNIPGAWFEIDDTEFPIDLYYADLDGIWIDNDNDLIYDKHSGNVVPEIWIGRLAVPKIAGDEGTLLNQYFDRNHRYRTGTPTSPWWRGIIYIDDGGTGAKTVNDAQSALRNLFPETRVVTDRRTTNASDYKHMLRDPLGYHWVYLMCHGTQHNHTFMVPPDDSELGHDSWFRWDERVDSSDYVSINPRVAFYHLVVCSAAKYTDPNYLAGSAIFGTTHGLLAVGSTQAVSSFDVGTFYRALAEGKCVGEAFHEWTELLHEKYDYRHYKQFYGLTLIGDPTLRLYHEVHDVAVTTLSPSLATVLDRESLTVEVTVANQGDFTETFSVAFYYDFTRCGSKNFTLAPGSNETFTFCFPQLGGLVFGSHSVEVKTPALPKELDVTDNTLRVHFKGRLVSFPVVQQPFWIVLIDIITSLSVFVACGALSIVFLKILMSERVPLLSSIVERLR